MTVNVKKDGVWKAATDGGLRIKAGGVWKAASFCYIKSGGVWKQSSYRGYPLAPTNVYIGTNSLSYLDVWYSNAPAGGAPVALYTIQELDVNSNPTGRQWNTTAGAVTNIGVAENTRYQYRVRSQSAAGLTSGWYGPVAGAYGSRILTGVSEQSHQALRNGVRAWGPASIGFTLRRSQVAGIPVPANVTMTQWYLRTYLNFTASYISKPPAQGNRQMYYYYNNTAQYNAFDLNGTDVEQWIPISANGAGGVWGIWIEGIGWSPAGGNDAQLLLGGLNIYGNESYQYYETVIDRAYRANALY